MLIKDVNLRRFRLSETFLSSFKGHSPPWGPIGEFTFFKTYARRVEGEGRKEQFWETLRRVVEGMMNIQKFHCYRHGIRWDHGRAQQLAQMAYELAWDFKWLPSGRGLWLMGTDFVYDHGSAGLNSCAFASTAEIDAYPSSPFAWAMEALTLGVGVGFDVRGADKLVVKKPGRNGYTFTVPDSREGWVESVERVLDAFLTGSTLPKIDYSAIRPKGAPLKSFGGTASGPEPLRRLHESLVDLLGPLVGKPLGSDDIVDAFTLISQCVVSGNVRRSAMIALGESEDSTFLGLKANGGAEKVNRWHANNSVIAALGSDYGEIAALNSTNGEPGVLWLENVRKFGRMVDGPTWADRRAMGVNPCGEQALEDRELCNLVETFPARHATLEEYKDTLTVAHLYGKSVTLLDTHWPTTNLVMQRNRRMGVSQSGIVQALERHGHESMRRWCDEGYRHVRSRDRELSEYLRIPESVKLTSVKPSGTVSLLPGATPGIHYPHSEYYIRRQRISNTSDLKAAAEEAGYRVEPCVGSEDTTSVIEFPVHEGEYVGRTKRDVSMWEQLCNAAMWQKYWADNQVSITVTFSEAEAAQIPRALTHFEDQLKCVSLLPLLDDVAADGRPYAQLPYEAVSQEVYDDAVAGLELIDYSGDFDEAVGEKFCDGESCSLD